MDGDDEPSANARPSDEENAEFWVRLEEPLSLAMELIQEFAEREGIDLDSVDVEAEMVKSERDREAAQKHDCSQAALAYSDMADSWFGSSEGLLQEKGTELQSTAQLALPGRDARGEASEITDAGKVIRWYQNFMYPKIMRALQGKLRGVSPALAGMPTDSDGSAKIALIAIDRSMAAWANLLRHLPEKEDETLQLLAHLERLRRSLESAFPGARAFVRPGFDECEIGANNGMQADA